MPQHSVDFRWGSVSSSLVWLGAVVCVCVLIFQPAAVNSSALCAKCKTEELMALHRYYLTLDTKSVTFRQFVVNLLTSMSNIPSLQPLHDEMTSLIWTYDDCMRTCDIPFFLAKRHLPSPDRRSVYNDDTSLAES